MIPLLTRDAVRAVDQHAIESFGVPGLLLMENAGRGATDVLLATFEGRCQRVVIVGGPGQNGGDAWVVARHLLTRGLRPRCVLVGPEDRVRGDARVNLEALRKLGQSVHTVSQGDTSALSNALRDADCWVDGVFGTGLDRDVGGVFAQVLDQLNDADGPGLALDLPSGLDANTGQVLGTAVRAQATATFAAHKRGLHQHPGMEHAGVVTLVDIGVPPAGEAEAGVIEPGDVAAIRPARAPAAHKGSSGHVLVIAGSPGTTGAAYLAGLGALRGGAGLVTLAARDGARQALEHKVVELMTARVGGRPQQDVLKLAEGKASAVLGPGLGLGDATRGWSRAVALQLPIPAVLDADALTHWAEEPEGLKAAVAPRVLTPHPGEASRLLGKPTAEVQADRYAAAGELAERTGQVVVLKGAGTIVATPDGQLRVCSRGTPALGVAGTGDVLSGALGAALALAPRAFDAATAGVWLHAVAGELASSADSGLLASEVADALPLALNKCRAWR